MANKSLLTYNAQVSQVEQVYYSPLLVLPEPINLPISSIYCFMGSVDNWADDNNPEAPQQTQKYLKNVYNNMFVAKKVTIDNISPVVQRIDWKSGDTYQYYQDDIDMFEADETGTLVNPFYIKNRYDQVFKCLWNNGGQPTTQEPFFQPGVYNATEIFYGTDGYKWKYLYSINTGSKNKFMDSTWMPVPVGQNTPNPIQNSAGRGNIEVINVTNGGSNYDVANAKINITVTGDGTGVVATPIVVDGVITDIIVTNPGTNYTEANVSISSMIGSGATAISPVSPVGGHKFDPVSELGCKHVMLTANFDGDEDGYVPTDMMYHQAGIIINPTTLEDFPNPASGNIYKLTTDLLVASGFSYFVSGEVVYQGPSLEQATFTAKVVSFDSDTNVIKLINTNGTLALNSSIYGTASKTARTILSVSNPVFVKHSGYLAQIQNRSAIQRSVDGKEQFRFVLGY